MGRISARPKQKQRLRSIRFGRRVQARVQRTLSAVRSSAMFADKKNRRREALDGALLTQVMAAWVNEKRCRIRRDGL
uniref:Uncharacterized protein n=1 Tax=Hyaloperonospora arabidopsidis (strain Emoy2) TaxID=559515 RepID=M4B7U4_HYAAE